ncbi:MAG: hypothetical protein QM619_09465 [Micropruina sp.]|uniref:hypothetical protein n=1 Tax=Micropruina sp. TaxID=2737536 RepID=UPI0039E6A761
MRSLLSVVAFVLVLSGCAGGPPASSSPAASASGSSTPVTTPSSSPSPTVASSTPTPDVRTITIELANGKVSPSGARVDLAKGDAFVLDITSDRDDEVHVHGFDKEIEVSAGQHLTVPMVADRTGRYEVESHHPEMLIVVLQIR